MIKIIIADDEAPARKRLKDLIAEQKDLELLAEAADGDQALSLIVSRKPDAAFLDINMPGAGVFETIGSLKEPPLIIFQTAYSHHAVDAFSLNAVDYLLKPVSRERFAQAVGKLKERMGRDLPLRESPEKPVQPDSDFLSVKTGQAIKVLEISRISGIIFRDGFSFIVTDGGEYYSDKPLLYYEELLEKRSFYRINRNEIVNLNMAAKVHPQFKGAYYLELKNGEKHLVSRRRAAGLKERLLIQ